VNSIGPILREALTMKRLTQAFDRVYTNHGAPGFDKESCSDFASSLNVQLQLLRGDVLGFRYQPQALRRVRIPRENKSPRGLAIPSVRDRVLQTALAMELLPTFEQEFEDCSFAYRQGRSIRQVVDRIEMLKRQGYRWVAEADIEQFFDRIPHEPLLRELRMIVHDESVIDLVSMWISTPIVDNGELKASTIGVPQGSPISPMLANLYLDHLDEALIDGNFALIRYADDFIVLTKTLDQAEEALELTTEVLTSLELKLNPLKTRVVSFDQGFQFLGWNFVRSLAIPVKREQAEFVVNQSPLVRSEEDKQLANKLRLALESRPFEEPQLGIERSIDTETDDDDVDGLPTISAPVSIQRTIYLIDLTAQLSTENKKLVVTLKEETALSVPAVSVDQVIIFGRNTVTTPAIVCCLQHGISVAYLSKLGKFYGRTEPAAVGNTGLLTCQFKAAENTQLGEALAREFIAAKLHNSVLMLQRYSRNRSVQSEFHETVLSIKQIMNSLKTANSLDMLRGQEGSSAALYFKAWRMLIPDQWKFNARQRPATDPINAMLNFGYTLLHQAVAGLLQARGLNAYLGHLHAARGDHFALASDVMEEFRATVVDSLVLNITLNNKLSPNDFSLQTVPCSMNTKAARWFVREFEIKLSSELQHPSTGEVLDIRRIIDSQVRSLCSAYRQTDARLYTGCKFK
jgi:CRISP-associated protein Cas1